jgi:predicted nucleic acid-binding protein
MNWFVDTNVLIYAIDERFPVKMEKADLWLRELGHREAIVLSPQSLNEFYYVATRRLGRPRDSSTHDQIWTFSRGCTAPLDAEVVRLAWRIENETGYHYYDCVLLASASRGGCTFFLSEDLQHGRRIGGLTIVNPFTTSPHDYLPSI